MKMDLPKVDAGTRLVRALRTMAAAAGCRARTESIDAIPWASATFVGTHYRIVIAADPCPALGPWLESLPEASFALPGHLVADLAVERVVPLPDATLVTVRILTLIDA